MSIIYRRHQTFQKRNNSGANDVIAAAVSEPEESERGSSLIGKKSHYRGIESRFLAKRK